MNQDLITRMRAERKTRVQKAIDLLDRALCQGFLTPNEIQKLSKSKKTIEGVVDAMESPAVLDRVKAIFS